MSTIKGPTYGGYTTATGCSECEYVWQPVFHCRMPSAPAPSICPECGAGTHGVLGRWLYSVKISWWGLTAETIVHKFVKGRG